MGELACQRVAAPRSDQRHVLEPVGNAIPLVVVGDFKKQCADFGKECFKREHQRRQREHSDSKREDQRFRSLAWHTTTTAEA
jgi:hypothetical protein